MRRTSVDAANTSATVGGRAFTYGDDLLASGMGSATGRVVYVGHGYRVPSKNVDAFAGIEVKDALLLVLPGLPSDVTYKDLQALKKGTDWWGPEENAHALGARGVIRVAGFDDLANWTRTRERQTSRGAVVVDRLTPEGDNLPIVTAGPRLLNALMTGEKESGVRIHERALEKDAGPSFALSASKSVTLTVAAQVTREDTFNVVASVDGADPVLRSEFIALGAHLDHLGVQSGERREEHWRQAGRSHQQRRRRRRVRRGGAGGDGRGGDARAAAEALAAVRLAHGRGSRRLGVALHHRVSAGADRPHRRPAERGHDRPFTQARGHDGRQRRPDRARRGVSRRREPAQSRAGRDRRERQPRLPEAVAEPEI